MTQSSWDRNGAWVEKFKKYVDKNCPRRIRRLGTTHCLKSKSLAMGFLANVAREDPNSTTRVDAAKRAINMLRAFLGAPSLDEDIRIKMLVSATHDG